MRKLSMLFVFLFTASFSFGQLSVKASGTGEANFIYVKDDLLFVTGAVNLGKNPKSSGNMASIYFREGAQLFQGASSLSENTGNGVISIFQEGTSNAYDYNYWASPVGNNSAGNGFFGIPMLYSPTSTTQSSQSIATEALNGTASPLSISSRWIHTYTGKDYSDWKYIGNKTEIPAGYGFTMKGVDGTDPTMINGRPNNVGQSQRYDFRGKPNNGNIEIPISLGQNILVGNPYPSAFDLSFFLLQNSGTGTFSSECGGTFERHNAITGIAYFWDSKESGNSHYLKDYMGGYGAFSPVDPCTSGIYERPIFKTYGSGDPVTGGLQGKHYERRYLPIAQGFMVEGSNNAEIKFKNSYRIYKKEGDHSDFKQAEEEDNDHKETGLVSIPKVRLEVEINGEYVRHLSLAFWPTATSGKDIAMDAQMYDVAPTDVGWLHGEKGFIIDVRPFLETEEIPLFLKVENTQASLKFDVRDMENFSSEAIYIFDSELEVYHPIKENSFQITLEPGSYHNRFKLSFMENQKQEVVVTEEEKPEQQFYIFQNNILGQLEISNPKLIPIAAISMFDFNGKLIFSRTNLLVKEYFHIPTKKLATSIYIVELTNQDGTKVVKKVSVANSR